MPWFAKRRQPTASKYQARVVSACFTYNDPDHGNPHRQSPTRLFAEDKAENTPSETSQVVYGNNDALKTRRRMVECIQEVLIAHNSTEHTLIVTK